MFLKTFSRSLAFLAVVGGGLLGTGAYAAEVSLLSGIYTSQSSKTSDSTTNKTTDQGKSQDINVGARYSQPLDGRLYWYAGGMLDLKSYSKGDRSDGPSDSTSLSLDGGVRYYFNKLSDNVAPFAEGGASFRDRKGVTQDSSTTYTESETNGLFYNASLGMRFNLAKEFFLDISTALFDSPLFATDKTDVTDTTGGAGGTKHVTHNETKRTDLYISSVGNLADARVGLGMRF